MNPLRVFLGIRPPVSAPQPAEVKIMPTGLMARPNLMNVGGSAAPNLIGYQPATKLLPK